MTRLAQLMAAKRAWLAAERAEGRNPTGMTPCNDEPWIRAIAEMEEQSERHAEYRRTREAARQPLPVRIAPVRVGEREETTQRNERRAA
jgi:hypothetical protein